MNRCYHCMEALRDRSADSCPYCHAPLKNIEWDAKRYLKPGTILQNKFFVGEAIGKGGFGNTYIGWNEVLQCKVAIKEYFPTSLTARGTDGVTVTMKSDDAPGYFQAGLDQFLEEARNVASLQDVKGVVQIYNFFRENGTGYIIMEFLEGMDVKNILHERGNKADYEWSRRVILTVLHTLREIHKRGILHRDIAPDNIFVTKEGVIKLIDFGAAKSAATGEERQRAIVLKSGYAPIEQYTRKMEQGPYTDLYAVAALFYRMLTGKKPPAATDRMRLDRMESLKSKGVEIPESAEMAITMCLYIAPEYRLQSAGEFMEALGGRDFVPVYEPEWILPKEEEPPQTTIQKVHNLSGAKKAMIIGGIVALIVLCVTVGTLVQKSKKSDRYVETDVADKFSLSAGMSFDEFKRNWTHTYGFSQDQLEPIYYYDATVDSDTIREFTDLTLDPDAGVSDFPNPGCFTNGNTVSNFQKDVKAYDAAKKLIRIVVASPYRVDFQASWANGLPYVKENEKQITYDQGVLPGSIVTEDAGDGNAWGKIAKIVYANQEISIDDLVAQNPVDVYKLSISVYTGNYYFLAADSAKKDYVGQSISKIKMPFGKDGQFQEKNLTTDDYSVTYFSFEADAGTVAVVKADSLKNGKGYDGRVDAPIIFGVVKEKIGTPLGEITVAELRKYCKVKGPKGMKASSIVSSVDKKYFDKETEVTVKITKKAEEKKEPEQAAPTKKPAAKKPKATAKPKATKKPSSKKNQDPFAGGNSSGKSKNKPTKKPAKKKPSKKNNSDPFA